MSITGYSVGTPNYFLRFAVILFVGVVVTGSIMFWRTELIGSAEYQDMPVTHEQRLVKKENQKIQKKIINNLLKSQIEE